MGPTRSTILLALGLAAIGSPALAAMSLSSADIHPGGPIAQAQINARCGGQDISPQLSWSGAPAGARSLVLTVIDGDAHKPAGWSHWIVIDLPPTTTGLPRGAKALPGPATAIANNFGVAAYAGPCPPPGSGVHHYKFTIWAMPTASTPIAPKADATTVAADLAKRALTSGSFVGVFQR